MSLDTTSRPAPKLNHARIRRFLQEQLHEREAILRDVAPTAAPNVDPVSWATAQATQRVMDQITAALDRLEAGTYGRCIRCGGAIVAARLDVMPYAENCIDCQRNVDQR